MILNRPLAAAEGKESRHYYILFSGVNGLSYMCLGETVLILFAVKLQFPDHLIACLGGMIYFGFLMLPLGKMLAAKYGAVRCQADCWVWRNIAALLVASAAPLTLFVSQTLGLVMLFFGAFFFYGFRAAGVVLSQPLVGEIASEGEKGRLIARSWVFFYSSNVAALLLITAATRFSSSVWMLFSIIITGTLVGICSSFIFRRISETGEIRTFAQRNFLPLLPELFGNRAIVRQMIAGMVCSLCVILIVPLSMLALKQGYHVSDTAALICFLIQLCSSAAANKLMEKYSDRFGGRKTTLIGFYGFYLIAVFWLLAPKSFVPWLMLIPFLLCSCGTVTTSALQVYFLSTIRKELQVPACIITSIATGVISGLIGMALSSGLLKFSSYLNSDSSLQTYRIYFLFVLILLPFFGIFIHRLPKEDGKN